MLYALLLSLVFRVAPAEQVVWTRKPLPQASFYTAGVYFCTRTRNLAAAVVVDGKVLSPHYAKSARPALIITKDNKADILSIIAVDAKNVHLKGGKKIPIETVRLLVEGDNSPAKSFSWVATDGKRVWLGASYGVSLKTIAKRLGNVKIMRLDGGGQTYAGTRWHRKLHNALAIVAGKAN